MISKIEDFFFNRFAGKLLARAAVTLAGYLAGQGAAVGISVDPTEVSAALIAGAHAAFEAFKAWRAKKSAPAAPVPETPAP